MRDLKVVGLDVDGRHIICEERDSSETFRLRVDDRLRAAVRGDKTQLDHTPYDEVETRSVLRPREIQSRIRAGASVEQLAKSAGVDVSRIERFAHPVLLERARAAELATAAHPILADGPAVLTLLETVTTRLVARGLDPDATTWDAWRNEDGKWTVQLGWQAGRSDNIAHFRYAPGAHGGTVIAADDSANELVDPNFDRPLRPVAPVSQLEFEPPVVAAPAPRPAPRPKPKAKPAAEPEAAPPPARARRSRPAVPAWEDVLLGVRSSGDR